MAFKKQLCNITQQRKRHERHYYSWFLCNKNITNELFIYKLTMELTTWWERSKKLRKGKRAGKRKAEENHEENWQRGEEWGKEREGKKMGEKKKMKGEWWMTKKMQSEREMTECWHQRASSPFTSFSIHGKSILPGMDNGVSRRQDQLLCGLQLPLTLKDRVVITPSLEVNPILIC